MPVSGSGSNGAKSLRKRQTRPQSAFIPAGARRRQAYRGRPDELSARARNINMKSSSSRTGMRRPKSAHSKRPKSGSGPHFQYARLLQRQFELCRGCKKLESKCKAIDEQKAKAEMAIEQHRIDIKGCAEKTLCDARNATAQHRRLREKATAILEKKLVALKRRCSSVEVHSMKVRRSIDTARKEKITLAKSAQSIRESIYEYDANVDIMLKIAKARADEIQSLAQRKQQKVQIKKLEEDNHQKELEESDNVRDYFIQLSQRHLVEDMRQIQQEREMGDNADSVGYEQETEHISGATNITQNNNNLTSAKADSQSIKQAFSKILPSLPQNLQTKRHLWLSNCGMESGTNTLSQLVDVVVNVILNNDKQHFTAMQTVQELQRKCEVTRFEVRELKQKCTEMESALSKKHSKFEIEIELMRSNLEKIRKMHSPTRRRRLTLESRLSLVVQQVVQILNQLSAPTVQKHINGLLIETKEEKQGVADKVRHMQRQDLISGLGLLNVLKGFGVVESEFLQILDAYVRLANNRGTSEIDQEVPSTPIQSTLGTIRSSTYQVPFGPVFPPGSLKKQFAKSQHHVRSNLQKLKSQIGGQQGFTSNSSPNLSFHDENGGAVTENSHQKHHPQRRQSAMDDNLMTREEIMNSMALNEVFQN